MDLPDTKEELIALIRPLHPSGFFPLAKGFFLIFLLVVLFSAGIFYIKNSLKARRRKKAFKALEEIRSKFLEQKDISCFCSEMSILLKRCCLANNKQQVLTLYGPEWCSFLEQTGTTLTDEEKYLLATQAFQPPSFQANDDADSLYRKVFLWMERNL